MPTVGLSAWVDEWAQSHTCSSKAPSLSPCLRFHYCCDFTATTARLAARTRIKCHFPSLLARWLQRVPTWFCVCASNPYFSPTNTPVKYSSSKYFVLDWRFSKWGTKLLHGGSQQVKLNVWYFFNLWHNGKITLIIYIIIIYYVFSHHISATPNWLRKYILFIPLPNLWHSCWSHHDNYTFQTQ